MNTMRYLWIFTGLFLLASCSSLQVSSDYDKAANFTQYHSFSFHQKGIDKLKLNDLDKRRIVDATTQELTAKGLQFSESEGDLVINILASSKEKIDVDYYNPYWGWYYYPWGGYPVVNEYREGTLIFDFVDRKTNTLVWQGKGTGLNVDNLNKKEELIASSVKAIISHYPPQVK